MENELIELVRDYEAALQEKKRLEDEKKQAQKTLDAAKEAVTTYMTIHEVDKIGVDGLTYSVAAKSRFSKASDAKLEEKGLDFFGFLEEQGLGDLIKQTVNAQTLGATMRQIAEDNGDELPEEYEDYITRYDYLDITRRKS